jgi:hypothetical protein
MANKLIGGVVQPFCNPCIKSNLTHEDKEGNDGKPIGGEDIEDILG